LAEVQRPRGFVDPLARLARVLYLLSLGVMHVYLPLFDDMLMDSDFYYPVFTKETREIIEENLEQT
jgi:hypothetical protein